MTKYNIVRVGNNHVNYRGVEMNSSGTILAENTNCIVIKWSAGSHWQGRGMPRAYHSPSVHVLTPNEDGTYSVLIEFDLKRS